MFNLFKSKTNPIFEEILKTSKEQIKDLENYKTLTPNGKYEVLIFSAYVILNSQDLSGNEKLKYLKFLNGLRKDYQVNLSKNKTFDLISSRIDFIESEFQKQEDSKQYFFPGLYNIFYENPLTDKPQYSTNLPENAKFAIMLSLCIKDLSQ
ncbi:hypothetical protein [Gillisia sp. JM1]|uniref:hypothetical protein n=1 Tax=Gillisia sp. JM1 TaxID=1283286 RepID=UPI0003FC1A4F|nr:hypothetical protein [Gillisia sp. JM1]